MHGLAWIALSVLNCSPKRERASFITPEKTRCVCGTHVKTNQVNHRGELETTDAPTICHH